jgi:flagellar hook protein FlgE
VPNSWELVRRQNNGEETVLAKAVVAFDLDAAGNLVYSNGNAIYGLDEHGKAQCLLKDRLIQDVVIV